MTFVKWALALLLFFSAPANAREVLPVAMGHQSAAFVVDPKKARLATGARVEFIATDKNGIPRKLPNYSGLVLGMQNGVVFFELPIGQAAALAKHRAKGDISYRKTSDPVPEEVAVRQSYQDSGHAVKLAPQMRRLTVTMPVDAMIANAWVPGEMLTFVGARAYNRSVKVNGTWETKIEYRDVKAMFRAATETANGQFEVTVVADPWDAIEILRAELEGRLSVDPDQKAKAESASRNRCYVIRRAGNERVEVEIPCSN